MPMILPLLLLAQAAATPAQEPVDPEEVRYGECVRLVADDPVKAEDAVAQWRLHGGKFLAAQCLGMAYTQQGRWALAAGEFEGAAHSAEVLKDKRTATYWAQAGNAWLAAGDAVKARAAIDAALAGGMLAGLDRGEAQLDHARALVVQGDLPGARGDLDRALESAAADPMAWLLSATLARRMQDLPRAKKDIAEALTRSADDASVQLEAGNIAAMSGEQAYAQAAWKEAARLSPDSPAGKSAVAALAQFATPSP